MRRLLLILVVVGVIVAACGGNDDNKETSSGTSPTTAVSNNGGNGSGGALTARCQAAATAMAKAVAATGQAFTGGGKDLDQSVKAIEAYADAAPSEIRADLKKVAEGYAKYVK